MSTNADNNETAIGDNIIDNTTAGDQNDNDSSSSSYRQCAAQSDFDATFSPPTFRTNAAVEKFHTRFPRFGHSKDINDLIVAGNNAAQKDYLTGLVGASFAMFALFFVWTTILLVFKCLGPSRVGFCSAKRCRPVKPVKPEPVYRQERIRKKQPFQHNGVASGYGPESPSKKRELGRSGSNGGSGGLLKPVVGVAKAPIAVVSKARKKKRELERRHQFSKMKSSASLEGSLDGDDEDESSSSGEGEAGKDQETAATPNASNLSASSPTKPDILTDNDRKIIREYEQEWKAYEQAIHRQQDRIRRIRIGAGFCACGITVSALLFTIMTYDAFTTSFDTFLLGLDQVNSVIDEALQVSSNFAERQQMARESTRKFFIEFNEICPNAIEQVCTNINDESATTAEERGCDFSPLPYGEELQTLVQGLDTQLTSALDDLQDVESDLLELQDLIARADTLYPKHATWAFWSSAGCALALGLITLILTGGMVYVERGQGSLPNGAEIPLPSSFKCCRSWFLIPLMLLLVMLSWIFSMVFILVGIGSSDLCYNSPDIPMLNMLALVKDEFNSLVYGFLRYYIQGCPAIEAPRGLEMAIQVTQSTIFPAIGAVTDAIQNQGEQALEASCGTGVAPYLAILNAFGNQLCALALTIADLRALFQCDRWYPMYRLTMHESICGYATQGFTWAASTQIMIVVLSLILLTLRVSCYDLGEVVVGGKSQGDESEDEDDDEEDDDPPNPPQTSKFCCFGGGGSTNRRQVAPKSNSNEKRVGEITVDRKKLEALEQAKAQKAAEAAQQRAAEAAQKEKTAAAAASSNEGPSSEHSDDSGSFDEESLKG